jgi:hypothetical protein
MGHVGQITNLLWCDYSLDSNAIAQCISNAQCISLASQQDSRGFVLENVKRGNEGKVWQIAVLGQTGWNEAGA